ncbi:alcohol dehydrogenase catalytic domain-containing protein [Micromonospora sp. WMMC241]|uniref:alcohol dehydrogenase catalytic domain-containing protein n=1 Tax=Micromonospora sp. WMMC241 TaxID=3015159 RepID=UPI0022B69135|nr:alcohol dehydrogenase catalytic domain-containing protein [Micromonospora sp. WMMC241]MCZ7438680.1 alcohol dehydrogenase catalytic domain-containing protein [Micromonospora sp. WMMC241]
MRAVVFDEFGAWPEVRLVADPTPAPDGVVLRVGATGLCRSDWHGWQGHDPDIRLPHVPGHEFAGVVAAVGADVRGWRPGDRVTAPFVCACGRCPSCLAGDQQVCERQTQPGFTGWGSFAEYVAVRHADVNLVRLPDAVDDATAAALGCRFATAFRAVVAQGRVAAGEWVAVHGCGGVGLSAVMVAAASGARVVAVDVAPAALELARRSGAAVCLDGSTLGGPAEVAAAVREATGGGAHLSLDALGSHATCVASIEGLRRRGRHVQVGLLPAARGRPALPMELVIAYELELRGSHGMPAHAYPELLRLVTAGVLRPGELVTGTVGLAGAPAALATMDRPTTGGMRLVRP